MKLCTVRMRNAIPRNDLNLRYSHPTITRLTSDTALREMFQMYIRPSKSTMMTATVNVTMRAMLKLNPKRRKVTTKMAAGKKTNKQ